MLFGVKKTIADMVADSWYLYAGLLLAVIGMIWVIIQLRTRLRDDTDRMADHWQLLQQMQEMHREGDLTEEEYRSIKGRLISQNEELLQQSTEKSKQSIIEDCPDKTSTTEQDARD
ncbi:MAG: hypothetical protein R3C11_08285 [Planctomycetaceae bacterium]